MKHPTQELPHSRRAVGLKQGARSVFYANRALKFCWSKGHQFRCQLRAFRRGISSWLFDARNGIYTSGYQRVDSLTIKGLHGPEATGYGPVDPGTFKHALSALEIDFSEYVFVDFGSGKGRAVLMASLYPFKRVIGVEFAKELHEVALENARTWRPKRKCDCIQFFWADALDFEIPLEPCVIYLANPFSEVMFRRILENLLRSIEVSRRDIIILYLNPDAGHAMHSLPNLQPISTLSDHPYFAYRIKPFATTN
jgi:SAM-dependent methyltransferase